MSAKKKAERGKKNTLVKVLLWIIGILAVLSAGVWGVSALYYDKLNYQPVGTVQPVLNPVELTPDPEVSSTPSPDDVIQAADDDLEALSSSSPITPENAKVSNILFIGSDQRPGETGASRADTVMILSINEKTEEVVITSILRDCYVAIPGHGNNRINASHTFGGPALLIETIEKNFRLKIDAYVSVNLESFPAAIDALGGVEINVAENEIKALNKILKDTSTQQGVTPKEEWLVKKAGLQVLDGRQALAYSRIRSVGTDFARTSRQRTVLEALFTKAKGFNLTQINKLANEIFPLVTTSITHPQMLEYLVKFPAYQSYQVKQLSIPVDKSWSNMTTKSGQAVLKIGLQTNTEALFAAVYGEGTTIPE